MLVSYAQFNICICTYIIVAAHKWEIYTFLIQDLPKEVMNYGLYISPTGGKPGKFLDETRLLLDYAPQGKVLVLKVGWEQ